MKGQGIMKTRIITSILGIALFFALLAAPPFAFKTGAAVICAAAIFEIYKAAGITKIKPLAVTGAFGVPLCVLWGMAHGTETNVFGEAALLVLSLYIGTLFLIMICRHEDVKMKDAAAALFGAVFPALLYSYIFALRGDDVRGVYLLIILFAATWSADGGAYFAGVNFGRTPLAPVLSPKKTVEGAIGGIFGSVLASLLCALLLNNLVSLNCSPILLALTGALCALLGPVGDIATSAIKRENNLKDFGKLFPGHGGVLDRFDSVLLTAPLVFFMNEFFGLLG